MYCWYPCGRKALLSLLIGMYRERNIAAWQSKAGQAVLRACVYLKLSESFLSRLMITKVNWWYLRKYSTCEDVWVREPWEWEHRWSTHAPWQGSIDRSGAEDGLIILAPKCTTGIVCVESRCIPISPMPVALLVLNNSHSWCSYPQPTPWLSWVLGIN